MLRTHRAGKGAGGCGGWGLGSRNRRGPGLPPSPVSEGRGPHLGASRLPGLERAGQTPSSPLLLLQSGVWEGPSHLPPLISPASLLCPQGPMWPGGQGIGLGAQQAPLARVGGAIALRSSPAPPGWPLPPATPDLPSLLPMPPGPTWPRWRFR